MRGGVHYVNKRVLHRVSRIAIAETYTPQIKSRRCVNAPFDAHDGRHARILLFYRKLIMTRKGGGGGEREATQMTAEIMHRRQMRSRYLKLFVVETRIQNALIYLFFFFLIFIYTPSSASLFLFLAEASILLELFSALLLKSEEDNFECPRER